MVVVIADLRRSVQEQNARAVDLARQDAQRGARELRMVLRSPAARAWVKVRIAWLGHRTLDTELRDRSLAQLDGTVPDAVGASVLLLCAQAALAAPAWATGVLSRLAPERAEAVLTRLTELGRDVQEERLACARVRDARRTLSAVAPFASFLAKAKTPQANVTGETLLLYYPSRPRGLCCPSTTSKPWSAHSPAAGSSRARRSTWAESLRATPNPATSSCWTGWPTFIPPYNSRTV